MIFGRKRPRDKSPLDHTVFWICVDVALEKPLLVEDPDGHLTQEKANGAIMSFGVTADSEEDAKGHVNALLERDPRFANLDYRVQFDHVGLIEDLQKDVYGDEEVASALLQDPRKPGLWYRTGVGWYDH